MLPSAGSLLIASATLVDPNFARCLLLMLDSDEEGSLGVIINQPSETPVSAVLGAWEQLTSEPGVLFRGGPVEGNAALALGALSGDVEPPGWRPLSGRLGLLDLDADPDDCADALSAVRVYAGYAGWGAGQLDAEIAEGSWHVVNGTETDLFTSSPDLLWRDVLRRQPTPLSLLTTLPGDASQN